MSDRVISTRELNRALLARQLLLERSSMPLPRALEAVGGLQTQYAPSGYVGLWSRLRNFRRDALTKALINRDAIQGTLMRSTIHTVSRADYPILLAGVRSARQEWWLRVVRHQAHGLDMDVVAGSVRKRLSHGPARAAELKALLAANGMPAIAWSGLGLWLEMIRVPPSGTWDRRQADLYGLADDWVGAVDATEEAGIELLVRRYLGGFGPAKLADIASWAGLPPAKVIPVVERMRLRRFRDEEDKVLFDLPRAPLPDAGVRAPVRFLQTFEALLMIHARRTQVMPEQFRPIVFNTKTPHSMPVFLIDGAVAGTWRHEGGQIVTKQFEPIPRSVRGELAEEAKALAAFHAD
ncbi:MAG TPA: winged helix DNA-binding domain-containing protein [Methylomirabilota bacterium]|nr:winged helix DNA-binding domain-containing protein [Methylomirabilota bacterium]